MRNQAFTHFLVFYTCNFGVTVREIKCLLIFFVFYTCNSKSYLFQTNDIIKRHCLICQMPNLIKQICLPFFRNRWYIIHRRRCCKWWITGSKVPVTISGKHWSFRVVWFVYLSSDTDPEHKYKSSEQSRIRTLNMDKMFSVTFTFKGQNYLINA